MCAAINDVALDVNGATISFASSTYDGLEGPNKMIDGQRSTYWATSGLYPQQFILSFPKLRSIYSIKLRSYLVRLIQVEKCEAAKPGNFHVVCEKELDSTEVEHQVQPLYEGQLTAYHIRFTILSGYDHICAIYKIEVEGSDPHTERNTQREFGIEEHGNITNRKETNWGGLPKQKTIPFTPSTDTVQEFEESPIHLSNHQLDDGDDDDDNDNNDNITIVQPLNDFSPVPAVRSSPEIPVASSQIIHGAPQIIPQRSPSASSLANTTEVARPSTAQRSVTGRNSIMKKTRLEMFTESDEVSSGEEF